MKAHVTAQKGAANSSFPVRALQFLALSAVVLGLSGCSALDIGKDEYSCPGMPDGVQCMSARDVYAATNDGQVPRPVKPGEDLPSTEAEAQEASDETEHETGDVVVDNYVAPQLPDRPIPVRTPAQVMRIWVAPWETTTGDLVVTGYIYTEIEPRRWVIGESAPVREPRLQPLQTRKSRP